MTFFDLDKDASYWRGLVAATATVEMDVVTQFSPKGFSGAIGGGRWFSVRLGRLALVHDGKWVWVLREETLRERMRYAHKDSKSAFAALRKEIAPDEPACAAMCEDIWAKADERDHG